VLESFRLVLGQHIAKDCVCLTFAFAPGECEGKFNVISLVHKQHKVFNNVTPSILSELV